MTDSVASIVNATLRDTLRVSASHVVPHALLVEDLGADSLDIIEVRVELEDIFSIDFTDTDWDGVRTVQDVINLAERRHLKVIKP